MIEELKYLIDATEDKPKIKKLLLRVAALSENKQKTILDIIKMICESK